MENYKVVNKGIITLSDKVIVSDPCYGLNTWCQGVVENVLPGEYECKVGFSDEDVFGNRVADIEVIHRDYPEEHLWYEVEKFEVGVDSGQAGIFDYEYYKKYHTDRSERKHVHDEWYDKVCDLTYTSERNPNYEVFEFTYTAGDVDSMLNELKRRREYEEDWKRSSPYLHKLDGNTIDGLGLVSSSGYGDGGYTCWTAKNDEGKVIAIRVEFIGEYEEDDE